MRMTIAGARQKRSHWTRALIVSFGLLGSCFAAARLTSVFIGDHFPDRPLPRDLLFEALPYVPWTQYLTDIALYLQAILLFWYISRGRVRRFPEMAAMFSIMHLLRAMITTLTPLAGPLGNGAFYGLIHVVQNGEFPSGHVGGAVILYLFVNAKEAPLLKAVMLALAVIECVSLLLSHGHYSIDIVGGILLAYFVYHEFTAGKLFNWLKPALTV
jgi:membrane-associated phospholipid phosphatase